ncbi:MAG: cyanophycinase [Planctomycetota bacterium]
MSFQVNPHTSFWKRVAKQLRGRAVSNRRPGRRRAMQMELLESRQNFAVASSMVVDPPTAVAPNSLRPLAANSVLLVPTGETPVHFFLDGRNSNTSDELGYFFVDGPDGRITKRIDNDPLGDPLLDANGEPQYVRPNDPTYYDWALSDENSETVFAPTDGTTGPADKILDVQGDKYIAFYVVRGSTLDDWRQADTATRPPVWFSLRGANSDGFEHFQPTPRIDSAFRRDVRQYNVETSNLISSNNPGTRADFNDLTFAVNIVPFATQDDYSVFSSGADFTGQPVGFQVDTPNDRSNRGLGLLGNDKSFRNQGLTVTAIRIDDETADWVPLVSSTSQLAMATLSDPSLHGSVTIYANGGIQFAPDVNDSYWYVAADDAEPDSIYFEYEISDGLDTYSEYVSISHGFYQRGGVADNRHTGQQKYLLGGGGDTGEFGGAATKFFTEGSNLQDIVLIAQHGENKDWVDQVYTEFTNSQARSVTSLNITLRDQANDPRMVRYVNGADALWFGGGAQSAYQQIWRGTRLMNAIASAAAGPVAIGGTSAGLAILGQMAYIDRPWDSVKSRFATNEPRDPRIQVVPQPGRLPFGALSKTAESPLWNIITDSHFSGRNRMGRLATFMTKLTSPTRMGVGVDEDTGLLIEKAAGGDWSWSVYGLGSVYVVTPSSSQVVPIYQDSGRLTYGPLNVVKLPSTGAAGALNRSTITSMAPSYRINVKTGSVYTTENGGSLY